MQLLDEELKASLAQVKKTGRKMLWWWTWYEMIFPKSVKQIL